MTTRINWNSPWLRAGSALLLVAGAGLLRWSVEPLVGQDMPLWLFVPAVMLAAWFGGVRSGLLSLAASVIVADYFFMAPRHSFLAYSPVDQLRLLVFMMLGGLITWLSQQRLHHLQELRESEARFAAAFAASPLALSITSLATGRLLEVNDTFVQLTGYTRAEALGRTPVELGLWLDPREREQGLAQLRAQGCLRNAEHRFRMRDGAVIVALLSAELLQLDGQPCVLSVIDEITERKEAEARLQAAELRYRNFIGQSSEGIWRCELTEPIPTHLPVATQIELLFERAWLAECNDAMARQYGFTAAAELIGKRLDELLIRTDLANQEYLRAFIEAHYRLADGESAERGAQGEVRYFLNNLVGQVEQGFLVRAWGTQRDITDQRQAAQALRESEHRYRTLISQVREYAIFSTDPSGIINTWNEGCLALLGYRREDFLGKHVSQIFTPEDIELGIPAAEMEQAHYEGAASNDRWMMRQNGERFWASGITTALRNNRGEVTGFTKVMRDLTERQMMEEALRDSEARFRQLADAMPQIVWAARADGIIDYYNRRGYEFLGVAPGEHGLRNWEQVLHPDDVASYYDAWFYSLNTGQPFEREYRFRDQQRQTYRWHLGRALPIRNPAGEVVRWFGTSTDIDDLKRANEERARLLSREQALRVQAEQASRLKDEFLNTISHELRTPLHHILGNLGLLRGGQVEVEERERILATIERNARVQQQVVEDLLDTSDLVTTSLKLQLSQLDLRALVQQAVELARPQAEAKQIVLIAPAPAALPLLLWGDEQRLQQALGHLLANALKFTPPGGHVTLTLEAHEAQYILTISDTGQGIAPGFLPQVFDRFSQQDSSSTRRFGGLGLGLALVKHIVELHGGAINAESPGMNLGATFTLRLPVQPLAWEQDGGATPSGEALLPVTTLASRPVPRLDAVAASDSNALEKRGAVGDNTFEIAAVDAAVMDAAAAPFATAPWLLQTGSESVLTYKPNLQGVRVWVVEAEAATRDLLIQALQNCQAEVVPVGSAAAAYAMLTAAPPDRLPDVLVCDLNLPGEDSGAFLQQVRALPPERRGNVPAVALIGMAHTHDRLRAFSAGFQMHVSKPVEPAELTVVIASLRERKL